MTAGHCFFCEQAKRDGNRKEKHVLREAAVVRIPVVARDGYYRLGTMYGCDEGCVMS
jgi:hypothetical protein